jgi:DNA-binding MarR family transcriptional regulator
MVKIAASSFAADDGMKERLQDLARLILDEADRRHSYFPRFVFDDMPWRMLLILYVSETSRLSSESLRHGVLAPPSTGNRWIDYLASEGLVTRHVQPSDETRSMVELTPKGIGLLELYLGDRLQRAELRTGAHRETAFSRGSRRFVGVVVLVTAALSACLTYMLMSSGTLARALDWN